MLIVTFSFHFLMIRSLHFREFLDLLDIPILIDFLFLHKPLAFSCAASLKTNFTQCICAQMLLFLPLNKDDLSRKSILFFQICEFILSLNVPQLLNIFVYKQRICLLECLVLFVYQDFHQFQESICLCLRGDL